MENGRSKEQQCSQRDAPYGVSFGLHNMILGQLPPSLHRWRNLKKCLSSVSASLHIACLVGSSVDDLMQIGITETGKLRH